MDLDTPPGDGPQGPQKSGTSTVPGNGSSEPDQRDGGSAPASGGNDKASAKSAPNPKTSGDNDKATAASASTTKVSGDNDKTSVASTSNPNVSGDNGKAKAAPASNTNPTPGPSSAGVPDRVNSKAKQLQKERAAEEHKKRNDSIKRALWATVELEKTIKHDALVESIDYRRLWGSIHFRDAWLVFSKKAHPQSRDVENLRKMAVKVLAQKQGKTHKGSAPKRHGGKGEKSACKKDEIIVTGERRKREESSSSSKSRSSSSGGLKPDYKIPKVDPTNPPPPPTPATATTGGAEAMDETPTDKDKDTAANEEGIVEGEGAYDPLESFAHDLDEAIASPYADATKGSKKKRMSYPWLLYVHKGKDLREKIPRTVWNLFKQKLNELLVEETIMDKPTPDIDWTGYKDGTGVVATVSEESRSLAMAIIDKIEVAEFTFRGWPKGAKETKLLVTIKVPPEFKTVSSGKLVQAMAKKNHLKEEDWRIYTTTNLNGDSGERIIKLVVEGDTFDRIRFLEGRLMVGSRTLEVFYMNNRLH